MEMISVNMVMDRLLVNPLFKGLHYSTVSAYMKDFSGINRIYPIRSKLFTYIKIENYRGLLPSNVQEVKAVFSCIHLDPSRFEDDKLGASLTDSILRDSEKVTYGTYQVNDDVLKVDFEKGVVEVLFSGLRVDGNGFPVLPYDGSLMMALTNFIKWQHYTILAENDLISMGKADKAHTEYCWYIGQYTTHQDMPTYDEAIGIMNNWMRMLDTRNKSLRGSNLEQNYRPGGMGTYGYDTNNFNF